MSAWYKIRSSNPVIKSSISERPTGARQSWWFSEEQGVLDLGALSWEPSPDFGCQCWKGPVTSSDHLLWFWCLRDPEKGFRSRTKCFGQFIWGSAQKVFFSGDILTPGYLGLSVANPAFSLYWTVTLISLECPRPFYQITWNLTTPDQF